MRTAVGPGLAGSESDSTPHAPLATPVSTSERPDTGLHLLTAFCVPQRPLLSCVESWDKVIAQKRSEPCPSPFRANLSVKSLSVRD